MRNDGAVGLNRFMILPFLPRYIDFEVAGPERDEEPSGKSPPPESDPFSDAECGEDYGSQSRLFVGLYPT